jgi:hypothetical protein
MICAPRVAPTPPLREEIALRPIVQLLNDEFFNRIDRKRKSSHSSKQTGPDTKSQ